MFCYVKYVFGFHRTGLTATTPPKANDASHNAWRGGKCLTAWFYTEWGVSGRDGGSRGQRSPAVISLPATHMWSPWSSANTSWENTSMHHSILQPNTKANIANLSINTNPHQFHFQLSALPQALMWADMTVCTRQSKTAEAVISVIFFVDSRQVIFMVHKFMPVDMYSNFCCTRWKMQIYKYLSFIFMLL